jgi:predicted 3-demethylubiquinone-9 3-methyltransferase (glyoxalase superfamily)
MEAAEYYCSVFKNSRITQDTPLVVNFELNGRKFMALNGGPQFNFNESVSFVIDCETQEEVDYYWDTLTKDGEESMCGWLKDRYGVSWQVVPTILGELMQDPERGTRAMQALLKMRKLDIAGLMNA